MKLISLFKILDVTPPMLLLMIWYIREKQCLCKELLLKEDYKQFNPIRKKTGSEFKKVRNKRTNEY